ncbi:MAG: hypothetical protein U9N35_08065 [Euryarchaeota archaeon]|nr:hypothetical protein [Euryarchaeota archaeon]
MIAVKVAYDGTKFFGSQIQKNRLTVEGELRKFFDTRFVSRTDKGVSALGNVFFVDEDIRLRQYSFDGIWLYGKARTWEKPFKKRYAYFLSGNYDEGRIKEACRTLSGKHDFFNFCKKDRTRTVDYTKEIEIRPVIGECIRLDFTGESFLWEMVRRLTTVIAEVGRGGISLEKLEKFLEERTNKKPPPSPPEYLLLTDIEGFEFSYEPYLLKRVVSYFEGLYKDAFSKQSMFDHSLRFLGDLDV